MWSVLVISAHTRTVRIHYARVAIEAADQMIC